jgi:hypothetical protein
MSSRLGLSILRIATQPLEGEKEGGGKNSQQKFEKLNVSSTGGIK